MLAICKVEFLVEHKAPNTSSYTRKKDSKGKNPGAKSRHRKQPTFSKHHPLSKIEATKGRSSKASTRSKTSHLVKETQSSSALDINPSQPPASTHVVVRLHKEDQQTTGKKEASNIAQNIEEEFNTSPALSSSEDTKKNIKLEDLSKIVQDADFDFIDLDSPKDDEPIIIKDESDEEVHAEKNQKLEKLKSKVEAEVSFLTAQPSFPNVKQLTELLAGTLGFGVGWCGGYGRIGGVEWVLVCGIVVLCGYLDVGNGLVRPCSWCGSVGERGTNDECCSDLPTGCIDEFVVPEVCIVAVNKLDVIVMDSWLKIGYRRLIGQGYSFKVILHDLGTTTIVSSLATQVAELKTLQWELPAEFLSILGQVSSFKDNIKTLDALPTLLSKVTKALDRFTQAVKQASPKASDQDVPSTDQAGTHPAKGEKNTKQAINTQLVKQGAKKDEKGKGTMSSKNAKEEETESDSDDDAIKLTGLMVESSKQKKLKKFDYVTKKQKEEMKDELIDLLGVDVVKKSIKKYKSSIQYEDLLAGTVLNEPSLGMILFNSFHRRDFVTLENFKDFDNVMLYIMQEIFFRLHQGLGIDDHARTFSSLLLAEVVVGLQQEVLQLPRQST
ncbi:hypothetical protein Tco_1362413 [Tanacetum coccineum]